MKNNNIKKIVLKRYQISALQSLKIQGGVHTSCTPDCNITKTNLVCLPTQTEQEVQ